MSLSSSLPLPVPSTRRSRPIVLCQAPTDSSTDPLQYYLDLGFVHWNHGQPGQTNYEDGAFSNQCSQVSLTHTNHTSRLHLTHTPSTLLDSLSHTCNTHNRPDLFLCSFFPVTFLPSSPSSFLLFAPFPSTLSLSTHPPGGCGSPSALGTAADWEPPMQEGGWNARQAAGMGGARPLPCANGH